MTKEANSRVIGRDRKVVKRALDEEAVARKSALVATSYDTQRELEEGFQAFAKYAQPRVRRTLDPSYEAEELAGEAKLTIEQARAMNDDLEARRKLRGAAVAQIKAQRRLDLDAAVNGYEYSVADVELVANDDKLEVAYVDERTGEELDRRAMTDAERQLALAGTDTPSNSKRAPATTH